MEKILERLTVKLCEGLPCNLTIYERESFCEKPSGDCKYCKENEKGVYSCNKKTYTPYRNLSLSF